MTRKTQRLPKLRYHKHTNRAYCELNGKRHYLGAWNTEQSEQRYHALIGEWLANGRRARVEAADLTVAELCAAFLEHARQYYPPPPGEIEAVRIALRDLANMYGGESAATFGPSRLETLRRAWIARGLSRSTINHYGSICKRAWRWAVGRELVRPEALVALSALGGLRAGRSPAKEPAPIGAVSEADLDAVRAVLTPTVRAMVDLQLLCGARPGEIVALRTTDFDRSEAVWKVRLEHHKCAHRGKTRTLYFGPKAQELLRPRLLERGPNAFLFSPAVSESERRAAVAHCQRWPGAPPTPRATSRTLCDHYTVSAYRRSIAYACRKAGVPRWNPNQLRHNAATRFRRAGGLDAAQLILGHATADVTQIHAEPDEAKLRTLIQELG